MVSSMIFQTKQNCGVGTAAILPAAVREFVGTSFALSMPGHEPADHPPFGGVPGCEAYSSHPFRRLGPSLLTWLRLGGEAQKDAKVDDCSTMISALTSSLRLSLELVVASIFSN